MEVILLGLLNPLDVIAFERVLFWREKGRIIEPRLQAGVEPASITRLSYYEN